MNQVAHARRAKFIALLLRFEENEKAQYIEFLQNHHIGYLDGSPAYSFSPAYQLLYDTHPNDKMTAEWARLVAGYVKKSIKP